MIEEKIVIGKEYPLDGMLTLPDASGGPFPAVVLVHGSGAHDMDEKISEVRPFKDIAQGLAARGIATIRYNKRSLTYGKQLVKDKTLTLTVKEETVEDGIFAADFLRKDSRIDPDKIFIAGHSMGGMLAPRIDADGGNFAGIIIMAGSPRRLEEIMEDQQKDFLVSAKGIIKWIGTKQVNKIQGKLTNLYDLTDEEAKKASFLGHTSLYYLKEWGEKPAGYYLEKTDKPILVVQGAKDLQVSVEKDFNAYQEILANHPNATFKLYPTYNHAFMPALYDDIKDAMKEFKEPRNVSEDFINDLADWIHAHV